jgi:hypothetical protein
MYKGYLGRFFAVSTSSNDAVCVMLCAFEHFVANATERTHFSFHMYVADTQPFDKVETAI